MIVPLSYFYPMHERVTCQGSSFETGSPIAADDNKARYVDSIAKIIDHSGTFVGWIYLAHGPGAGVGQYVEGNRSMDAHAEKTLRLRFLPTRGYTSIALLRAPLPDGLRAARCLEIERGQ